MSQLLAARTSSKSNMYKWEGSSNPLKGGCQSQGIRVGLRAFKRETLLWINLLNKVSTSFSRSMISNSNACNWFSWHATLVFWNALETRDHLLELGTAI
uniref:Uncharacterized protein n=1 Tax=Leersia perrieri TaxID=77586 RepID=A0A0D9XAP8_9ORYZ